MSKLRVDPFLPTVEILPGDRARFSWPISEHVRGRVSVELSVELSVASHAALMAGAASASVDVAVADQTPNALGQRGLAELAASVPEAVKRLVDGAVHRVAYAEEVGQGPEGLGPLGELPWLRRRTRRELLNRAAKHRAESEQAAERSRDAAARALRLEARASILEAGESE